VSRPLLFLESPQRTWKVPLSEFGGRPRLDEVLQQAHAIGRAGNGLERVKALWDTYQNGRTFDLSFEFDERKARRLTWNLASFINRASRNGQLRIENDQIVDITEGTWGRRLNVDETVRRVVRDYRLNRSQFPLLIEDTRPQVTMEDLQRVNGVIGRFTTQFNPGKLNRTWNIHLVSDLINGCIVPPHQVFSFNTRTGSREAVKGYRVAQIFVNKKIVEGVGGGVCQVSSTLYNAALQARLPIVERHTHSLPVPYIRSGRDATVAYPYRDLRFQNNTNSPVYLQAVVSGNRVTITLWGNRGSKDALRLTSRGRNVKIARAFTQSR
jgi:vancomycin resistance protein YoaR